LVGPFSPLTNFLGSRVSLKKTILKGIEKKTSILSKTTTRVMTKKTQKD